MDLKNSKLMLLTAVFSAFSYMAQAQYLSAKDIYKYAKSRNYNALSRISGYIDTQDGSGNTALCLAVMDDDYQTYNLLRQYGANPQPYCLQSAMAASGSSTFLGMGTTGWLVTGAIVAGGVGIAAAAGGGGGGGGSSDSSSSNGSTTPITCVNGSISNGQCQCNDGWTGDTCNTAQTCSYNTTSCTSGYEETGNTCKSGNITYKECKAKTVPDGYTKNPCGNGYTQIGTFLSGADTYYKCEVNACPMGSTTSTNCPNGYLAVHTGEYSGNQGCFRCVANECSGYQSSCENGYHATTDTCLSGSITMYKCEVNDCSTYQTSCGEGYNATQSCLSGTTPYYTCTPKDVPAGYTTTPCGNGYTQVDTFLSGTKTYYKCEVNACTGYVTGCGNGYHTTSDTCQSGATTMYKCEANNCTAGSTSPTCFNGQHLLPTGEYSGNQQCFICVDDDTPLDCGTHGTVNGDSCQCDSGWDGTFCNLPDENHIIGTDGNLYEKLTCENGGTQVNASCSCPDGWEGNLCQNAKICSGYYESCETGYHTTSDTCKSGTTTMYKCEANVCEGYVANCNNGYHATTDTCLSGTNTMVKCEINNCSAYQTSCGEGYSATQSCLSGATPYYTCTPKEVPTGYTSIPCDEGYTQVDTFLSGADTYYKCEPVQCQYNTIECAEGQKPTGNTCKSGKITYIECRDAACEDYPLSSVPEQDSCKTVSQCPSDSSKYRCDKCSSGYGKDSSGNCVKKSSALILTTDDRNNGVKETVNNEYRNVYGLTNDNTNNHYNAYNGEATIKITNNSDGTTYGVNSDEASSHNAYANSTSVSSGEIEIHNNGNGGTYGLRGLSGATNAQTHSGDVEGNIKIENVGNGNVFGMQTVSAEFNEGQIVSDVLTKNAESIGGTAIASIDIDNTGSGMVHGMNAGSTGVNSLSNSNGASNGTIKIKNSGDGEVRGMGAEYLAQNATSKMSENEAEISIENVGDGNVKGIHSNGYAHNAASYTGADTTGSIIIKNRGNGDIAAITSADIRDSSSFNTNNETYYYFNDVDSYHLYNARANNGTASGIIDIQDEGNGDITVFDTIINNNDTFANYTGNITYNTYAINNGTANSNIKIKNESSNDTQKMIAISKDTLNLAYAENKGKVINNIEISNDGKSDIVLSRYDNSAESKITAKDNSSIDNSIKITSKGDGNIILPISITSNNSIIKNTIDIDNQGDGLIKATFDATTENNKEVSSNIKVKNNGNGNIEIKNKTGTNTTKGENKVEIEDTGDGNVSVEISSGTATGVGNTVNSELSITKSGNGSVSLKHDNNYAVASDGGTATNKINLNLSGNNPFSWQSSDTTSAVLASASGSSKASSATSELNIIRDGHTGYFSLPSFNISASGLGEVDNKINITNTDSTGMSLGLYISGNVNNEIDITNNNSGDLKLHLSTDGEVSSSATINNTGDNKITVDGYNALQSIFNIINEGNGNIITNIGGAQTTINNKGNGAIMATCRGETIDCGVANITNESTGDNVGDIYVSDKDLTLINTGNNSITVSGDYNSTTILNNTGNGAITVTGDGVANITNESTGDVVGDISVSDKDLTLTNKGNNNIILSGDNNTNDELSVNVINSGDGNIEASGNNKAITLNNTGNGNITISGNRGSVDITSKGLGMMNISGTNSYFIKNEGKSITDNSTGLISKIIHNTLENIISTNRYSIIDYRGVGTVNISSAGLVINKNNGYVKGSNKSSVINLMEGYVYNASEIANVGDGLAVGLYTQSNLDNSQDILIHNLGDGVAVGIYVDGSAKLTNRGNVTIDRESYDGKVLHDDGTVENKTYSASTVNGGKAIGIYGTTNSTIINQGTIKIDNADIAYGIFSEGGNVTNSGTILINGKYTENAIRINGGQLFQNGILKVGADWSDNGVKGKYAGDLIGKNVNKYNNSEVNIENIFYRDVMGLYISGDTAYNSHTSANYAGGGYQSLAPDISSVSINNSDDGNVYGMYGNNANNIYNAYLYTLVSTSGLNREANININNQGGGDVYGINGGELVYNAYRYLNNSDRGTLSGTVVLSNQGDGDVYGIAADTAYNSYLGVGSNGGGANNNLIIGTININNIGKGNVYGMYGDSLYNSNRNGSGYDTKSQGTINIINTGVGNVYGMFGHKLYNAKGVVDKDYTTNKGTINIVNNGTANAYGMYGSQIYNLSESDYYHELASTIEIVNNSNGVAVGIYSKDGSIDNSGDIKIHNLADGLAVGIYADGTTTITNSGNITIDRNTFTLNGESYAATSTKGGKAIGIYGTSDSTISNSGTITVKDANISYGIYTEGGDVSNTGTIIIGDLSCTGDNCKENASIRNAIVLNGGRLLQDGVINVSSATLAGENGCEEGTIEFYGYCYADLHCGPYSTQFLNSCVVDENYIEIDGNYQYVGLYNIQENINNIIMEQTDDANVYGMYYSNDRNGDVYNARGSSSINSVKKTIDITNYGDGSIYGMYSASDGEYNMYNAFDAMISNPAVEGIISIINNGNGDVYGMYRDNGNFYKMAYNAATYSGRANGTISITNNGNGDVYGIYGGYVRNALGSNANGTINITNTDGNAYGMYGYYTENAFKDGSGNTITNATINITNNKSGNAYGMHSGQVYNAKHLGSEGTVSGIINMTNTDGSVYGMYGDKIYNAYKEHYVSGVANGIININNTGNGLAYGIYGNENIYNSYIDTYYMNSTSSVANGTIKLINRSSGDVYGMYGNGNIYNAYNITSDAVATGIIYIINISNGNAYGMYGANNNIYNNTVETTQSSLIEMVNSGDGLTVGIYSKNGTINNSGEIKIHNLADGVAVGIYADGKTNVINSGNITINRESYADEMSDDEPYTANPDKFGKAVGIYGAASSNITNAEDGVITIDGAAVAYGIYSEGGRVTNKGTILINGEYTQNAIHLNGGKLFQNGTIKADGNWCGLGYSGSMCEIFDSENYIQQDGQVYTKLDCGTNGVQKGNNCICSAGYTGSSCDIYMVSDDNNYDISFNNTEEKNVVGLYLSNELEVGRYSNGTLESVGSINLSNHSDGDVYGILSNVGYGANADGNDGTIRIHNEGNGDVYGMYDEYKKGAINGRGSKGIISIDNTGNGIVYGLYGGFQTANSTNDSTGIDKNTKGIIRISNNGTGNSYGIYGYSGSIENGDISDGIINVVNMQSGKAYGMYNEGSVTSNSNYVYGDSIDSVTSSTIEMANVGDGLAVGMYTHGGENSNSGTITIHNLGDGKAFGIYAENDASNSGHIIINREIFVDNMATDTTSDDITYTSTSTSGGIAVGMKGQSLYNDKIITINGANTAIGMYGLKDSYVTNVGTITINGGEMAIGIYGENNSEIINDENGVILINGANTGYGIYAEKDANVTNDGTITINGVSCTGINCIEGDYNNAIVLNGGNLFQNGIMTVSSAMSPQSVEPMSVSSVKPASLNLNDFGGTVVASDTSQFIVEGSISGDLAINNSVIENGFDTTYSVKNMIQAEDTSGLNLQSQSALFDATLQNNTDAVMTMKAFNDVIENSSVADFLQNNYAANNNEDLFKVLKSAASVTELNNNIDDLFGKNMLSRMAFEDLSMLREVSFDMNNHLFEKKGAFEFGGNISPSSYDNNIGSVGRYSLNGYNNGKLSFGIGVSITDVRTDDGHSDNSRFDRNFMMSAPIGYKTHGFELITAPKMGYTDGNYDRDGFNNKTYEGKIQKRMFALMNEARYPLKIGGLKLLPSAEFNMIGYNIKGHEDEQQYALRIKSQNHYSVEAGLGLMAEKEFKPFKNHKFSVNGGVTVYHEFANPYELDVAMSSMSGTYRLHDEKRSDNRTVARFGFNYMLKDDLDVTAHLLTNIDREYRTDAGIDLKYHF